MRIKFIGQKGIPVTFGGVEYHVDRLAVALASRGHIVDVYVRSWYTPKTLKRHQGVRLIHVPTIRTKHLDAAVHSLFSTLHALFSRGAVIHFHAIGPALFSFIPRLFGKKTVVTIHRLDWATEKWGRAARAVLKLGEAMATRIPRRTIVVSRELKRHVAERHGRDAVHISHGIELPDIVPPGTIRKKFNLDGGDYVLFMGRLSPEKRVDWVIRGFQSLRGPGIENLKLVIAGGTSATDAYVSRLREEASDDRRIVFTGYVTGIEKAELLSNARVFVMPSSLEGYPIALLEGKSYGRCCLVSDIPPHGEAVEDGRDGRLFDRNRFDAFVTALQELIDHPETASAVGQRARRTMEGQPGWDAVAEQTEAVYAGL